MKQPKNELRKIKTVSVDAKIWDEAKIVLHEVGMTRSRFIELTLRQLVRSHTSSFADVTADIFQDVARAAVKKAMKEEKDK